MKEIREMVTQQMETAGFVRPTLFLVGAKFRLGYTCTSYPTKMDNAIAPMRRLGKRLAAENPEVGRLLRAYIAQIVLFAHRSGDQEPREVLLIHGVEVGTNKQQAAVFEALRDRTQDSMPFQKLEELRLHREAPTPEYPPLQAFVDGYLAFDWRQPCLSPSVR